MVLNRRPVELAVEDEVPEPLPPGRPLEDRSFEAVETTAGAAVGVAIGLAVGGPVGAAIGGVVGGAVAFEAGEALERSMGRAARTTDAVDEDAVPVD
jgi:uncharacterized membrane protein